eukprot:g2144.t1
MSSSSFMDVAVVGAGPAGLLAAVLMKGLGYHVHVFDKCEDANAAASFSRERSYALSISAHGIAALAAAGIDLSPDAGRSDAGPLGASSTVTALTQLKFRVAGRTTSQPISSPCFMLTRGELVARLLAAADGESFDEKSNGRILFHWGYAFDWLKHGSTGQSVVLSMGPGPAGTKMERAYDMVIGADGAFSAVRQTLQSLGRIEVRHEPSPVAYRVLHLGPLSGVPSTGAGAEGVGTPGWETTALHYFIRSGCSVVCARPKSLGAWTATVNAPFGHPLVNVLSSPADVRESLFRLFPEVAGFVDADEWERFAGAPVLRKGGSVVCSSLASGNVGLVGDAGHSMLPNVGQGANAALEAAVALVDALKELGIPNPKVYGATREGGQGVKQALAYYSARWLPEAEAVVEISKSYSAPRTGGACRKAAYFGHKAVTMLLGKVLPAAIFPAVNISIAEGMSFRVARGHQQVQDVTVFALGCSVRLSHSSKHDVFPASRIHQPSF